VRACGSVVLLNKVLVPVASCYGEDGVSEGMMRTISSVPGPETPSHLAFLGPSVDTEDDACQITYQYNRHVKLARYLGCGGFVLLLPYNENISVS
jgi:hypothetical protein